MKTVFRATYKKGRSQYALYSPLFLSFTDFVESKQVLSIEIEKKSKELKKQSLNGARYVIS